MSTDVWPWAGKRRGRVGVAEFFRGLAETSTHVKSEIREVIAQGGKVVVAVFERFVLKATGQSLENEYINLTTFKDGQVARWWIYEDTAPIIRAIRGE